MNLQEYNDVVGSISQEFAETGLSIHQLFQFSIKKMNEMYELPINVQPSLDNLGESPLQRMQGFMKTLQKEMEEGQDILALLQVRQKAIDTNAIVHEATITNPELFLTRELSELGLRNDKLGSSVAALINNTSEELPTLEALDQIILVMLADWLGDMTVYNRSEALKYGIPLESVLACIMGSNFTKLGDDG